MARKSPVGDIDTLIGAMATRKQSTRLQVKEFQPDQNGVKLFAIESLQDCVTLTFQRADPMCE